MSLYQKPGNQSSEYALVLYVVGGSLGALFGGVLAALTGHVALGVALIAAAAVAGPGAVAAYVYARSKVKVAAENNRPPQSRVA